MIGRTRQTFLVLAVVLVAGAALATLASSPPAPTAAGSPGSAVRAEPAGATLPTIRRVDLPPEARTTLERIAAGGPFPYRADGSIFENRERLLPPRPDGAYREYTVQTPGSADRGARRIVAGLDGERYWTMDHYASFSRIVP